jgi:hypothetical protein
MMLKVNRRTLFLLVVGWGVGAGIALAQTTTSSPGGLPLNDLSAFRNPGSTWSLAGDVSADLNTANVLFPTKGTGILVNLPDKKNKGVDLYSVMEHGDLDLELDYMIAKGSNSGIYLQGRYEIQLLDSWGVTTPKAGDNGGIYERWDESKPDGQKGYQGIAPRQNASRAPGLWQNLKISFQAPRFDAGGRKVENARMLRVELNGVLIHEDVELLGPTRGAISNEDKPAGPLRIQGDHGAVAFRNIVLKNYDKPRPELTNLKYEVYLGKFEKAPDVSQLSPMKQGQLKTLTTELGDLPPLFLIRYTGTFRAKEAGAYHFNVNSFAGANQIKINNQVAVTMNSPNGRGSLTLPAGDLPFEVLYGKQVEWGTASLGFTVAGPGVREFLLSDVFSAGGDPVDPILVHAPVNTMLRSFMDLPGSPRVTHAVSVGSPEQVHYTYDLDNGMVLQVWRGGFLNATPMWESRGDGSSRPMGAVQRFGKPALTVARLSSPQAAWVADTAGSGFRPKGYVLDAQDRPTFRYQIYGATVSDAVRVLDNGQGIRRDLTVENASGNLYARLAEGSTIDALANNMYLIDGKSYYLRLDNAGGAKPVVRDANGRKELIVPVRSKLSYSILF